MELFTFKGGVHPNDGKRLSMNKAIEAFMPSGEMVYPISQHIGAPAEVIVNKGDQVLKGQLIAKASSFVSANIHASVSGTVKSIEERLTVSGSKVKCIIIENDNEYKEASQLYEKKSLNDLSKDDIRERVREAGIVGMGGAGFPTSVKLSPKNADEIEYVIVNGAECEPYLTSDYRRMIETPEKIVSGLKVILRLFDKAQGIIAIEDNKPEAIKIMKKLVEGEDKIKVCPLKTKYPQGAERQLIYAVTKRKVNSTMLPADALCIVDNIDTVTAIHQAVIEGKPLTSRIVTVTGDNVAEPKNYEVPIGTNHRELIEAAGGFRKEPDKVISGGPMMGKAMFSLDVPIIKTSSAILALKSDDVAESEETNCINCGRCHEVCPAGVIPSRLYQYASRGNKEAFTKNFGMECCECGCCSYVCPAKKGLTQTIASMRKDILASRKK